MDPKAASGGLIKPGMTTTASAIVSRASNVLLVPNRAIKTQGGQKVVYVLNGRQQIPVTVSTGLTDGTNTEITGNTILREGDTLALTTSTTTTTTGTRGGGGLLNLPGAGPGR